MRKTKKARKPQRTKARNSNSYNSAKIYSRTWTARIRFLPSKR